MNSQKYSLLTLLIVGAGILTRLLPHLPNFSPAIVFALYLGMKNSKSSAFIYTLLMASLSDLFWSWQNPLFSSFGSWTIFTYSAFLLITWIGTLRKSKYYELSFMATSCFTTIGYWIWTNFGTWLMSAMYPHTLSGFIACYTFALPFLSTAILASIVWCVILMASEKVVFNRPVRGAI